MKHFLPEPAERDIRFEPVARKDGLQINSASFVAWSDIEKAKLDYYFGYPYISFKNKKVSLGFRWKVPLHLGDHQVFRDQVMQYAPWGNSFREVISKIERVPANKPTHSKLLLIIGILILLALFARTTFVKYIRHKTGPIHFFIKN